MIKEKLQTYLNNHRCTLLGVGPMSKNCVDAAIELAKRSGFTHYRRFLKGEFESVPF